MRFPGVARLGAISALVLVSAAVLAPIPFAEEALTGMGPGEAKAALRLLRGALAGRGVGAVEGPLAGIAGDEIPLVVTAWRGGRRWRVFQADGRPFAAALEALGADLERAGGELRGEAGGVRLSLGAAVSRGWAPDGGLAFGVAFIEGRTGVSGVVAGRRVYVLPSELIRQRRYGSFKPLPAFDPRFRVGLDAEQARRAVAAQASQLGLGAERPAALERFTAVEVVVGARLEPLRLLKGTVERPALSRARLDGAVLAGARYLERCIRADGTFRYHYAPLRDQDIRDAYNWPRHAGVAYSLALVGRLYREPALVAAAQRALARFVEQLDDGPGGGLCLHEKGGCYLGSSALGLLAIAEQAIASGDRSLAGPARRLATSIAAMQREDGFFHHDWTAAEGIDRESMKLYASQQAVLALARYARAFGDDAALAAAERGMDYLAGPYWDHFLGSWFFGQEHWSCLAAEELYGVRPKPEYARLCLEIGEHYDRLCHAPGETPFPEDIGGMSVTHFFTPHVGGTATAAEAMVSAVALGRATGAGVAGITAQLGWTLAFLEKGQLTEDDAFWLPSPATAVGGVIESQTKMQVRIDNVQHAISAMARGRDFVFPADGARAHR